MSALDVGEVPPGVVTVTVTVPAACAGAFTVISDEVTTDTVVPACPVPKATVAGVAELGSR